MTKKLMAKIDTCQKDGKQKGKYIEVGVILSGQHGEYALLRPHIDLAGILVQQRLSDPQKAGKSVLCSIFNDDYQQESGTKGKGGSIDHQQNSEFDDDIPF